MLAILQMKLLLVEDDKELGRRLLADLTEAGHEVTGAREGNAALELGSKGDWDVIIMDVSLPGLSGFEVVKELRKRKVETPVIFLTARADVANRVEGLSIGGDDYLTKPFALDELKARLLVLQRRHPKSRRSDGGRLPEGWTINALQRRVTVRGEAVDLQPREWSLLEVLMTNEGQIMTKSHLLDQVWGLHFDPGTNVVDAAVCRLRRKLDPQEGSSHFETVRGRGYIFHRDA